ncbi:hypothetical protein EYR40_000713 [Pleurotus pulmonarius]|nr:hypothetical protein EYR36_004452 [Pleurotus pulmonarius]KAF4579120.1 hypothetical protein EYR36_000929 [Pleurotus pulmonarius]KAF4603541.1 hypothetical protein EYR38_003955 [Pleurotus pulmonarius]KAF4608368.1 hypothetical protein EYR40_000713 [Pleurotus pulmonarius]
MNIYRPLASTHPQFTVLEFPGFKEYRVENWRLSRNGSGKVVHATSGLTWREACHAFVLTYIWPRTSGSTLATVLIVLCCIWLIYNKCTQVLYESVIVMPSHGIQLETHRGIPPLRLAVSRRFIPFSTLQDIFIHEGLKRWDVRFYLAALRDVGNGHLNIDVCFPNVLPYFPVLLLTYQGIQEMLDCKTRE